MDDEIDTFAWMAFRTIRSEVGFMCTLLYKQCIIYRKRSMYTGERGVYIMP
jgi:hypothetical protein